VVETAPGGPARTGWSSPHRVVELVETTGDLDKLDQPGSLDQPGQLISRR
jgi:hypothetical protein